MSRILWTVAIAVLLVGVAIAPSRLPSIPAAVDFVYFETSHVHPLARTVSVATRGADGSELRRGQPNPLGAVTTVEYALGRDGPVSPRVFDILGRSLRALVRRSRSSGSLHTVTWDGRGEGARSMRAGMSFIRLESESRAWTRPVILLR